MLMTETSPKMSENLNLSKPVSGRDFSSKVAIVTGSGAGIGAEIAALMARYGAQVVINGLDEAEVMRSAARANGESEAFYKHRSTDKSDGALHAATLVGDVTDSAFARKLINQTVKRFGRLDILVNNAGGGCVGGLTDPKMMDHFDRVMRLNVRAVVELTRLAVPHLEKTRGNIVNISTILSAKPAPNNFVYCMSKASLDMFTKCSALELASKGIRVNSVNPGSVRTNWLRTLGASEEKAAELYTELATKHPIGRVGEAVDVACAVAFLVSDEAAFVTGSVLTVDGGMQFL